MSTAALQRRRCRPGLPGLLGLDVRRPADRLPRSSGVEPVAAADALGAATLDDLVADMWKRLSVCEAICCPVCGGEMASRGGSESGAIAVEVAHGESVEGAHGEGAQCGARLC